jgi:tetratricopeptide (TPR) repeat protein
MGCIDRNNGRFDEASKWFLKASEFAGNDSDIPMYLGEIFLKLKQPESAKAMFEKVCTFI